VYVIRRGWHVDVAFDSDDLSAPLASFHAAFPAARYLVFGFGDRHYLLHKSRLGMALALWPGPGLILVTGLRATPAEAFGETGVIKLSLSRSAANDVQGFVWRSLISHDGQVAPLQEGPYAGSTYYASTQTYSAFYTCNTWAAQALRAGGLSVRSFGVEFAGELWSQVRRVQKTQAAKVD
jgi:hypothetical protein